MQACEQLGLAPYREDRGTIVFRVTLGQSRQLMDVAGELGISPVIERGRSINFRTTVEEHEVLTEAGARVGLSATGFAAIAALEGAALELGHRRRRGRRVKDFEALRQMVVELQLSTTQVSKAGVLLNQAVAKLHAEGATVAVAGEAAKDVVDKID